MTTKQLISSYRATIRWFKARIRRDEKRLEIEPSYRKREYLKARIINDLVAIDDFESRIFWMTAPPTES